MEIKNNKWKAIGFCLALIFFISLVGCSQNTDNSVEHEKPTEQGNKGDGKEDEGKSSAQDNATEEDEMDSEESSVDALKEAVQDKISSMTMEEKVGQMLMIGFEGTQVNDQTRNFMQENHIGGVILFERNITDSKQLLNLNRELKELNADSQDIPLFISVDEEGGVVSRMPPKIVNLPDSKEIGDLNNTELAYQVGEAIGERVNAFGFNVTMAPVMDVNSNPDNPIIGKRSFGDNKEIVSDMGVEEMKGIQSKGIIPVIKHFPGHGDTDMDSHLDLPVVHNSLESIREMELVPFQKAIDHQADMTMVAHILLPEIDNEYPSSLSKNVVTTMLREELRFNGVAITDDMTMGAILENYDIGDATVKAVQAGNDIVLVCHGDENKLKAVHSLTKAVESGTIKEERINESVERILLLKEKYNLSSTSPSNIELDKINQSSEEIIRKLEENE
ncbi:Beta-hexosaminidase A precursor [Oceanobacillus picturae]|uniref:Beta-hexosaminidase A n=1 Tax=Oceanobacillus picturae TaxID=171693 RepID=W9AFJ2_9BACI|nr:beta-N-acetylhexosaminidase [Oceanobacillus picturae]CDO04248.1 Beta-hexosaminidase A precursor [Oceanobacillus picturae]